MYDSSVRSLKILRGLGGITTAKNDDLDVRGGNYSSSPKPDQEPKGGQLNSTGSSAGDRVARGKINGRIGC